MEKHKRFVWECQYCQYVTARKNGKHSRCPRGVRPLSSICHNRATEDTKDKAKSDYEDYRKNTAHSKILEVKPEGDNLSRSCHAHADARKLRCARVRSRSPMERRESKSPIINEGNNPEQSKNTLKPSITGTQNQKDEIRTENSGKYLDISTDKSDDEAYVPREVISTTTYNGNV